MPNLAGLVRQALSNAVPDPGAPAVKVCADAAYDSKETYLMCAEQGVEAPVPVRRNFSGDAGGCTARKEAGFRQLGGFDRIDRRTQDALVRMPEKEKLANQARWREESGHNERQSVEAGFPRTSAYSASP